MPQRSEESVQIFEGDALLTRRTESPYWQLKFRMGRRFVRVSTKENNLKKAKKFSTKFYSRALLKHEDGQPLVSRRFKSVAKAVRDRFRRDYDSDIGPVIYRDYFQAIDNWLIPFFGSYNIASIDHKHIKAFYEHRRDTLKRDVARSTINTHATAMQYVFDEAVEQGYMNKQHVPLLRLKGYTARLNGIRPRAAFSIQEYRKLYRRMRYWVDKTKKGKFTDMRYLLRDVVLLLANSGIRYGTELHSIRWNSIQIGEFPSGRIKIEILVDGKVGPRRAYLRSGAIRYLERIWQRSEKLKHLSWEELLAQDEPVFTLPDGTVTKALDKVFTRMLLDFDLLHDKFGQTRSLYSLRHFYITYLLFKNKVSPAVVAYQCGTSIQMIQRHYFHGEHDYHAEALSE